MVEKYSSCWMTVLTHFGIFEALRGYVEPPCSFMIYESVIHVTYRFLVLENHQMNSFTWCNAVGKRLARLMGEG